MYADGLRLPFINIDNLKAGMLRPEHSYRCTFESLWMTTAMKVAVCMLWNVLAVAVEPIPDAPGSSLSPMATFLQAASEDVEEFRQQQSSQAISSEPLPLAVPLPSPTEKPVGDSAMERWWCSAMRSSLLADSSPIPLPLTEALTEAIDSSPRIAAISRQTSIAYEKIVQQDAVFDPTILLESGLQRVNDPVGNTLTTGGPPRSILDSTTGQMGVRKLTRRGTEIDVSQQLGTLNNNSLFFSPANQGNSRLSLSVTQPLLATNGVVYNTRLVTQASIDSRVAWQEMRGEVEQHILDTFTTFWRLYERRAHLSQQRDLVRRGEQIGLIVEARAQLDSAPLQRAKVQRRLSERMERLIELEADIRRLQIRLRTLIGDLQTDADPLPLELIPMADPGLTFESVKLRDAIVKGLENRPDIKVATEQLSSAGLAVNITKNELRPRLDAVFSAYVAGLNGDHDVLRSFGDQFATSGPGAAATLQYELPYGRRASLSRHREARYRYSQRAEELRDTLLVARQEIESALILAQSSESLTSSRSITLDSAVTEESISQARWETLGADGGVMALVLEDLLESQSRRTAAEQSYVSAMIEQVLAMIELQRAMGTLLIQESIELERPNLGTQVEIYRSYTDLIDEPGLIDASTIEGSEP